MLARHRELGGMDMAQYFLKLVTGDDAGDVEPLGGGESVGFEDPRVDRMAGVIVSGWT